jgi:hypothetical protein
MEKNKFFIVMFISIFLLLRNRRKDNTPEKEAKVEVGETGLELVTQVFFEFGFVLFDYFHFAVYQS